jgi:hypothetical protein
MPFGTKSLYAALFCASLALSATSAQSQTVEENEGATPGVSSRVEVTFDDLLSGRRMPLRIQLRSLTSQYRRIAVSGSSEMATWMRMIGAMQGGNDSNVYYTRGETAVIGGETYLLAYRPQVPIDVNAFRNHAPAPTEPQKLSPRTVLALSLLNLRTSGSLNDVRPFDRKLDMQSPQEALKPLSDKCNDWDRAFCQR